MAQSDEKAVLCRYLQDTRGALLWKLDGLSEYDVRRPLVPTGTNLLGLVKHLASVEIGYFGDTFGRPFTGPLPWDEEDPTSDLFATSAESREFITGLYRQAWAHSDATIEALELDATGRVPWWPADRNEVTLHRVLVHVIAETSQHAGHADIVRELIDGAAGLRADRPNLPSTEQAWWSAHRDRVETAAREAAGLGGAPELPGRRGRAGRPSAHVPQFLRLERLDLAGVHLGDVHRAGDGERLEAALAQPPVPLVLLGHVTLAGVARHRSG
jgi:hypothetical protein